MLILLNNKGKIAKLTICSHRSKLKKKEKRKRSYVIKRKRNYVIKRKSKIELCDKKKIKENLID